MFRITNLNCEGFPILLANKKKVNNTLKVVIYIWIFLKNHLLFQ